MTARAQLLEMLEHLSWANRRAWSAIQSSSSNDAERLFAHLLAAERVWLDRMESGASVEAVWPDHLPAEGAAAVDHNVRRLRAILDGPGDLERAVGYTNTKGQTFTTPIRQILVHVMLHGVYHRGQIAQSLRASGAAPEVTDFIHFVRTV